MYRSYINRYYRVRRYSGDSIEKLIADLKKTTSQIEIMRLNKRLMELTKSGTKAEKEAITDKYDAAVKAQKKKLNLEKTDLKQPSEITSKNTNKEPKEEEEAKDNTDSELDNLLKEEASGSTDLKTNSTTPSSDKKSWFDSNKNKGLAIGGSAGGLLGGIGGYAIGKNKEKQLKRQYLAQGKSEAEASALARQGANTTQKTILGAGLGAGAGALGGRYIGNRWGKK